MQHLSSFGVFVVFVVAVVVVVVAVVVVAVDISVVRFTQSPAQGCDNQSDEEFPEKLTE